MQNPVMERLNDSEVSSGEKLPLYRSLRKEQDQKTGFYYFGARYLYPKTSVWISADPAMGDYVPRAPIDDEARKHNGNLSGMGGVYNYVNLHVYHYAGNNPVILSDPDGKRQTHEQIRQMLLHAEIANNGEFGKGMILSGIEITVTRNAYEGITIGGKKYYKDNLSVRIWGIELNNIQVQSTVDWTEKYSTNDAPNDSYYQAVMGKSGATNPLINDTILIERDNFMHEPKDDKGRPYSGGCTVTLTKADKKEVMNILRTLGVRDGEKILWRFAPPAHKAEGNIE
jgi:RHS repeat-associated protein